MDRERERDREREETKKRGEREGVEEAIEEQEEPGVSRWRRRGELHSEGEERQLPSSSSVHPSRLFSNLLRKEDEWGDEESEDEDDGKEEEDKED